ncbi:MAG: nucleotide-binding protein [Flavobacteriia bacterium]|nr:nucleotide-binding protein [Flavobacteriia bacterium]
MKRKLFIGSSKEGLTHAQKLKEIIESELHEWIDCTIWSDGEIFGLNNSTLHSLVQASRKFDYGILVASKDDITKYRKTTVITPRDNVMFEMGMFLGSLGLTRAFMLVEEDCKLPTDYNGITVPYFNSMVEGSIDIAINQIIQAIRSSRNSFNIKPVPSAALALGYFESFIQKLAKKRLNEDIPFSLEILLPVNISDIDTTVKLHKRNNPSIEISIDENGSRPIVHQHTNSEHNYWDIPTNLQTLNSLMNLIIPSSEIGVNPEKQDWIEQEIRNFKGTLEVLINQCEACKGFVTVSKL